jgi:hypothetical protein
LSQPRVITADYVNWRTVTGRKALQLIFEIDISKQEEVLKMLGAPSCDSSRPCAIALLNNPVAQAGSEQAAYNRQVAGSNPAGVTTSQAEGGSPKKSWSEYTRSQQAAILCGDSTFQQYFKASDAIDCDDKLKEHFRIASKRQLDKDENHVRWDEFVALYNMHRDRLK